MKHTPLVNTDGSINALKFKCNRTNKLYIIVGSYNEFNGSKFWDDSAFKAVDTVLRADRLRREFTREELFKRFKDITAWKEPDKLKPLKKLRKSKKR